MNKNKRYILAGGFAIMAIVVLAAIGFYERYAYHGNYEVSVSFTAGSRSRIEFFMKNERLPDYSGCGEWLNECISEWHTPKLAQKTLGEYKKRLKLKADEQTRSDEEILAILANVRFAMIPHLDLITMFVRSDDPELATQLAKAYVSAIAEYRKEERRNRYDRRLKDNRMNAEQKTKECELLKAALEKLDKEYEMFRAALSSDDVKRYREGREKLQNELRITEEIRKNLLNTIQSLEADSSKEDTFLVLPGEVSAPIRCSDEPTKSIFMNGREWFYR